MNIKTEWNEVVTACGNVLRGLVEVAGKEFRLEMNLEKTHLQIIDQDSRCETCSVGEDGDVIADGGEFVTGDWTDSDWSDLKKMG
jgi:hypothetical protein